jgi:hypothetical protein
MTTCIGVFIVPTGFCFEKPRPGKPCGAWATGDQRGIRGFISTTRKFFKNDYQVDMSHQGHTQKIFSATEKNHKNPKNPVFTIRPGAAAAPQHDNVFKLLHGE